MVVGLLGNESSDSNRFTLVSPKPENGVRLQATLGNQNPTGLPVRAVRFTLVTPKPENGVRLQATLGNQNPTGLPVGAVRIMHR